MTSAAEPEPDLVLDCRGMRCPLPIIELAKRIADLPPGARVRLLADDPAARADVPAWCRLTGHEDLGEGPPGTFLVRRAYAGSSGAISAAAAGP